MDYDNIIPRHVKEEPPSDSACSDDGQADANAMVEATQQNAEDRQSNQSSVSDQQFPEHDENSYYNVDSTVKQTLHMSTGEAKIVIQPKLASSLNNASNLTVDRVMLNRVDVWHQVIVHHEGICSKEKILEMVFGMSPLGDIFPVAYRRHANVDFFMIRMCSQILNKMFEDGLKLRSGQLELALSIRLGAARFQNSQIFPRSAIAEAVQERCDNADQYGMLNVLHLDNFASHPRLEELCIYLGNRPQFEAVCSAIGQTMSNAQRINTLRLSNNSIYHATPLAVLKDSPLVSLDLRDNRIRHPSALRTLQSIPLMELYVKGNSLTDVPDYEGILRGFFPTLLKLDASVTALSTTVPIGDADCEEEVEMSSPGVVLTDADLNTAAFEKYQITPHWHLVTVQHNGICGKQEILDALFQQLGKFTFFPCHYKTFSKRDEFLVRNCFEALLSLVQQKLQLPLPSANAVLKLSVAMNVAEAGENHVVPLRKLEHFVLKRFDQNCLNLCSMQEGLNAYKHVDFSVKSLRIVGYILEFAARKFGNTCFVLRLRDNQFPNCHSLGNIAKFQRLVSLDLRYNSLSTLADLKGIPANYIEEVFLDHNPLCSSVSSSAEYIWNIKQYFHNLKRLDGRPLVADKCFTYHQNYICTPEAYKFADAFVTHYFSLYDSFQRADLRELYHSTAQFSMTTSFDMGEEGRALSSHQQRQVAYKGHSRNLLQFNGSLDRAMAALVVGNERIAYILTTFPKTELDYSSFRIDVPIFTPNQVVITIHGRLKEESDTMLSETCHLGFTRTFYIRPCGMGTGLFSDAVEYKICNDMLHLYNLSYDGQNYLNKRSAEAKQKENAVADLNPTEAANDRENSLIVFGEMTKLNRQWSVRCLEESSWNLKVALNVFLKLYESRRIPKIAFVEST